jgi:hypothetical protein
MCKRQNAPTPIYKWFRLPADTAGRVLPASSLFMSIFEDFVRSGQHTTAYILETRV